MTTIATLADRFCDPDANGLDWSRSTATNRAGHFRNYVLPQVGDLDIEALTHAEVNEVVASYDGKAAYQLLVSIKAFLTWVEQRGHEHGVVRSRLKSCKVGAAKIRQADVPSWGAVQALVNGQPEHVALPIEFAALTGVRSGELAGLTPDRLDFEVGRVLIDRQLNQTTRKLGPTKSRRERWTILPGPLEDRLARRARAATGPLFEFGGPGEFVPASRFRDTPFRKAVEACDVWDPAWTMHSLRHHFATHAINVLGIPIADVSAMLGHSTISMTMDMYVTQSPSMFATARAAMAAHH